MSKEARAVVNLNKVGVGRVVHVFSADTGILRKPCDVRTKVDHRATLIEVEAGTHRWIGVPEILLVATVENILPQRALAALIILMRVSVVVGKLAHRHIDKFALGLELTVVFHAVVI